MTILVTGGAGYIGSHTVKNLILSGYGCVVVDNLVYGHKEAVDPEAVFVEGDLLDKDSLRNVLKAYSVEAVIHFAAYAYVGESVTNPKKYYENNVIGTLNLLDIMLEHDVKKIVFSSTCATYGEPRYTPIDEAHPQAPINPYGQSKLMVEKILEDYHEAYGLNYIALRYFNAAGASGEPVIGESHVPETHLIPLVLQAIQGKQPSIKVFGDDYETPDGTCIRDYIHVDDLASAHRLAVEKADSYSGYINLGTGAGTSVKEIIAAAEQITNQKCPVEYVERRPGDPARLFANNSKAKDILGWSPVYNDIHGVIQTAWAWEQNRRY